MRKAQAGCFIQNASCYTNLSYAVRKISGSVYAICCTGKINFEDAHKRNLRIVLPAYFPDNNFTSNLLKHPLVFGTAGLLCPLLKKINIKNSYASKKLIMITLGPAWTMMPGGVLKQGTPSNPNRCLNSFLK